MDLKRLFMVAKPDSYPHTSGRGGQLPGTTPAQDLTGKITKLDEHYPKAGGFSDVYKCRYTSPNGAKEVAVKAFRFYLKMAEDEDKASKTDKMIRRELGIWGMLCHPNIVPFLGFVYNFGRPGSVSLVSEWMQYGTLDSFCAQYDDQLMLGHRLQLLLDTANGLSYLHSSSMVHGDLTCTNVLIDHNFNARLTDFGLTSVVGDTPEAMKYLQMTSIRPGAIRWAAPEQISVHTNTMAQRTTKSDIYSFGNLTLFTLSGKHPWSEVQLDPAVILRLHLGDKPSRPTSRAIKDEHWEFIEHCWSAINERPQAEEVMASLKVFLKSSPPAKPLQESLCIAFDFIESSDSSFPLHPGSIIPRRVRFDDANHYSPTLPRKPSWHGQTPLGPYSPNPVQSIPGPRRRQSFDRRLRPREHASPWPDISSRFQVHPLLDGETTYMNLYFDLASPSFNLHLRVSPGQTISVSRELQLHATRPPVTRMRITNDSIPQWPIDLGPSNDDHAMHSSQPAITVGDVLYAIYFSLRQQIMHHDWAQLGQHEAEEISRTYTRRCRSVPLLADVEASQGVKRIDYLSDNHIFRGLVKMHDRDGFCCWKLIIITDAEYQRLASHP